MSVEAPGLESSHACYPYGNRIRCREPYPYDHAALIDHDVIVSGQDPIPFIGS